jgi:hypothetical protein
MKLGGDRCDLTSPNGPYSRSGVHEALGGGRPRPLIGLFRLQNDPAASLTGLRSIDKIDLKGSSS